MTLLAAKSGAGNTLIGVRSLLNNHLLVRALSAAAADANEPEEAGANGEGDANPEGRQHLGTHVDVDVVGLKSGFEYTGKCTVSGRGGCGSGNGEDSLSLDEIRVNKGVPGSSAGEKAKGKKKTYRRNDGGDEATPPRENSKETNNELNGGQDDDNDKSPVHPASNLLVHVHSIVVLVSQGGLQASAVHAPNLEGVKVELELASRAVGDLVHASLVVGFALAVREETDLVKVLELLGIGLAAEGLEEIVVGLDAAGEVVEDGL